MGKIVGGAGSPKSAQPMPGREQKGANQRLCDRFYKDERLIMRRVIWILFFLLLWVTGCNANGTEPTSEETTSDDTPTSVALEAIEPTETVEPIVTTEPTTEPTATAVRPTPTEEPTMASQLEGFTDPVIILKRSGGFAGLEDQWTIYADGTVEGAATTENPLSTEHIAQILADAEAGGFFDLNNQYIDEGHCCDFFNYEVTLNLPDGRSQTITTVEQTPSQPDILAQTILELNFLLFRERIQE